MKIEVLTIFPEYFDSVFEFGIIRRAKLAGIVEIAVHDIREYATDKHKMVDDRPFGGGDGMVLKPEPIFAAIENLVGTSERRCYPEGTLVVLLTPQGKPLTQSVATGLAELKHLGTQTSKRKLLSLARTDPDGDVRHAAMRAVARADEWGVHPVGSR